MQKTMKRTIVILFCAFLLVCGSLIPTLAARADETTEPVSDRYYDSYITSPYAVESEDIYYSRKVGNVPVFTDNAIPTYDPNTDLTNSCGATAGGILLGFYDKYYENLIPGYTTYFTANGRYKPKDRVYIPAVMQRLYTLMRTNVDAVGVSETDCLNGLEDYIEEKGYNVEYKSIKNTAGAFQLNIVKDAVAKNKLVLLFCDEAKLVSVASGNGYDRVVTSVIRSKHVMVAYGYDKIDYYNSKNELFRSDTYLLVATGLSIVSTDYISVNSTSWLDNGYVVEIY